MNHIRRLGFRGYRAFRDEHTIDLRPLTIVLGKNNSGKSSLVRSLGAFNNYLTARGPVLSASTIGLPWDQDLLDLHYGKRPHSSLEFKADLLHDGEPLLLEFTLQHVVETSSEVVTRLSLRGVSQLQLEWDQNTALDHTRRYIIRTDDTAPTTGPLEFDGILPTTTTGTIGGSEVLDTARDLMDAGFMLRGVGPLRRPLRRYEAPSSGGFEIESNNPFGDMTDGELLRVNQWLARLTPWALEIEHLGPFQTVTLRNIFDPLIKVHIGETGAGISQVLPILRALASESFGDVAALCIEQPELHLHPSAHADLAEIFLTRVHDGPATIIETHSEVFILRLRRAVAEGTISPEDLALYFVDSTDGRATMRPILVHVDGTVEGWPKDIFEEDYQELRLLGAARPRGTPRED